MPNTQFEIHISDVGAYKKCRRLWHWSSSLQRGLEPNRPYLPYFLGRAVHAALQDYYENGVHPADAVDAFMQNESASASEFSSTDLAAHTAFLKALLGHYYIWTVAQTGPWADSNLEFMALETEFKVPLNNPTTGRASNKVLLAGRFDGLVRRKDDGSVWLLETKTTRSIKEFVVAVGNAEQAAAYITAAQKQLGVQVEGVLYNLMKKRVPAAPDVRLDGQLSQDMKFDGTPEYYIQCVKNHHTDWTPAQMNAVYAPFISKLRTRPSDWFARMPVRRTQHELKQFSADLWTVALEMTRKTTPIYPSPSQMNCTWCQFRDVCLAYNRGEDIEPIFEHEFRPKREWDSLEAREV